MVDGQARMNKETVTRLKENIGLIIMVVLLIIGVAGMGFLGYKTYNAEKFCRDKGHAGGTYKALDGGYYSCRDYIRYNLNGVKKDGET